MVLVSGRGIRGYIKYGCPSHRYRGVCDNQLTIRQDRLEEQLLGEIETRILPTRTVFDSYFPPLHLEFEGYIVLRRIGRQMIFGAH